MAGIFDQNFWTNPAFAGSLGMMAAGGPSRTPVSLGQGLLSGFATGSQAYRQNQEVERQKQATELRRLQVKQIQAQLENERREKQLRDQAMARLTPEQRALVQIHPAAASKFAEQMAGGAAGLQGKGLPQQSINLWVEDDVKKFLADRPQSTKEEIDAFRQMQFVNYTQWQQTLPRRSMDEFGNVIDVSPTPPPRYRGSAPPQSGAAMPPGLATSSQGPLVPTPAQAGRATGVTPAEGLPAGPLLQRAGNIPISEIPGAKTPGTMLGPDQKYALGLYEDGVYQWGQSGNTPTVNTIQAGGKREAERAKARDEVANLEVALSPLRSLYSLVAEHGTEMFNQEAVGAMGANYRLALATLAKMSDAGVLQPGELPTFERALPPPTTLENQFKPWMGERILASISAIEDEILLRMAAWEKRGRRPPPPGTPLRPFKGIGDKGRRTSARQPSTLQSPGAGAAPASGTNEVTEVYEYDPATNSMKRVR